MQLFAQFDDPAPLAWLARNLPDPVREVAILHAGNRSTEIIDDDRTGDP